MRRFGIQHWPLLSVVGLYWVVLAGIILAMLSRTAGHLIYPIDDAYIHMAIAKHTALSQVWGVTRYEFTSSTSSPLWTALIAALYALFGVHDLTPLIVNVLLGTLTIGVAYAVLARYIASTRLLVIVLLVAIFAMPLPTLTLLGMEHVLHGLLSLIFLYLAAQTLADGTIITLSGGWWIARGAGPPPSSRPPLFLVFLAPLLTMTRYEGLFLVFVACVLLLLQRRIAFALILGGAALAPVILYGLWSVANGWFFLPNSILIKGSVPGLSGTGVGEIVSDTLRNLLAWHVAVILLGAFYLVARTYCRGAPRQAPAWYAQLLLIGAILLHGTFASFGGFFRYEAYLVLLGMIMTIPVVLAASAPIGAGDRPRGRQMVSANPALSARYLGIVLLLISMPFLYRSIRSIVLTPIASQNIYEQQYQMGQFLRDFYAGETVLVNDIGAVGYLADVRIVDIWGLGSIETARLLLADALSSAAIDALARERGGLVAISYRGLLDYYGGVPARWTSLGVWQIEQNIICASARVSLYALSAEAQGDLLRSLRQFAPRLPPGVGQSGPYVGG